MVNLFLSGLFAISASPLSGPGDLRLIIKPGCGDREWGFSATYTHTPTTTTLYALHTQPPFSDLSVCLTTAAAVVCLNIYEFWTQISQPHPRKRRQVFHFFNPAPREREERPGVLRIGAAIRYQANLKMAAAEAAKHCVVQYTMSFLSVPTENCERENLNICN